MSDQHVSNSASHVTEIVDSLNENIAENTRLKTTQISSSLLACAIEGAADERLLTVLDGLFSEGSVTQSDMKNLLRWGNSSGITVLAGMISALKINNAGS